MNKPDFATKLILALLLLPLSAFAQSDNEERLTIGGLLEVEAFDSSLDVSGDSTDIVQATVEIYLDARLSEQASASIALAWDEEAAAVDVDEAALSLSLSPNLVLNAGKIYVPFGVYATAVLSDPLTLELGETSESVVQLVMGDENLNGSVFLYNGDIEESSATDDTELRFGASLDYAGGPFSAGIHYLSSLDSGLLGDLTAAELSDTVAGMAVYLGWQSGAWILGLEHVMAMDDYQPGDFGGDVGTESQPSATSLDVSFALDDDSHIGISLQTTAEAAFAGLPENIARIAYITELVDGVEFGVEFSSISDYSIADGGAEDDGSQVLLRLASEF